MNALTICMSRCRHLLVVQPFIESPIRCSRKAKELFLPQALTTAYDSNWFAYVLPFSDQFTSTLHMCAMTSLDRHDFGVTWASHFYIVVEHSNLSIETTELSFLSLRSGDY